jgi:hypothetical protein
MSHAILNTAAKIEAVMVKCGRVGYVLVTVPTLPIGRYQGRGRSERSGKTSPPALSAFSLLALWPALLRASMVISDN